MRPSAYERELRSRLRAQPWNDSNPLITTFAHRTYEAILAAAIALDSADRHLRSGDDSDDAVQSILDFTYNSPRITALYMQYMRQVAIDGLVAQVRFRHNGDRESSPADVHQFRAADGYFRIGSYRHDSLRFDFPLKFGTVDGEAPPDQGTVNESQRRLSELIALLLAFTAVLTIVLVIGNVYLRYDR